MSDIEIYVARKGKTSALRAAAAAPSGYSIIVRFEGGLTDTQRDAFKNAANRWSKVITGDLPPVMSPDGEVIDDVLIIASGTFIDGPGRVLGRAGPTALRPRSAGAAAFLPAKGIMEFDTADLSNMEANGTLGDVIAHEMGHVIGIGTIWDQKSLLAGAGTSDPTFTGAGAMREYAILRGSTTAEPVPVEKDGGEGTRDSHWRDSTFGNELMTGFVGDAGNPVSRLTVASLADLGYVVDLAAAEPYVLPSPAALSARAAARREVHASDGNILGTEPIELPPESLVGG